jgi:peptidoglycan hydrolase CwlO-like protein
MKKVIVLFALIIVSCSLVVNSVRAIDCSGDLPGDENALRDYITACTVKLKELSGQKKTLADAITFLNSQIKLTQAQITATEKDLDRLNLEIGDLTGKIDSIDYSLTGLTKLFVVRVREAYIRQDTLPAVSFAQMQSNGIADFIRKIEYAKKIRDHDREILVSLEKSRLDFNEQKTEKETKQAAVEALNAKLSTQQTTLASQKTTKDKLLADTQNDEKKYSALLSQAQRQLASFRRFVSSQGGASILGNETKCDDWGCYYNQRDSAWGNQFIGLSDSIMREVGCLVTSMAMMASHAGKNLKPGDIAASTEPFFGNTAYMNQGSWTVNGVTMTRTRVGSDTSAIDTELAAGHPVVVGIYSGPDHFLVIKGKDGGDYIMNDPFPSGGANLKFTSKYPLSAISVVYRVNVQ